MLKQISFDQIIQNKDIEYNHIILLVGRPAMGKTKTCCNLFTYYKKMGINCLYFDLSGTLVKRKAEIFLGQEKENIITNYHSSLEIIKQIEAKLLNHQVSIVFIDSWELVSDKSEWFINKLLNFHITFIITESLPRKIEKRRNKLPKTKDLQRKDTLAKYLYKQVILLNPHYYNLKEDNDLKFYEYAFLR